MHPLDVTLWHRRLGDKTLRALAANALKRQRTHAQLATSTGSGLNRQSRSAITNLQLHDGKKPLAMEIELTATDTD